MILAKIGGLAYGLGYPGNTDCSIFQMPWDVPCTIASTGMCSPTLLICISIVCRSVITSLEDESSKFSSTRSKIFKYG